MKPRIIVTVLFAITSVFICNRPVHAQPSGAYQMMNISSNEHFNAITTTSDGNVVATGSALWAIGTSSTNEIIIAKVDPMGNAVWIAGYFQAIADNQAEGNSIAQVYDEFGNDDGYIVTGWYYGAYRTNPITVNLKPKIILLKVSASGNLQWYKIFTDVLSNPNDEISCTGMSIIQTSDGGFAVTGNVVRKAVVDGRALQKKSVFLLKTDYSGTMTWSKVYTNSTVSIDGYSVKEVMLSGSSAGYAITGKQLDPSTQAIIIRTDNAGSVIWSNSYNTTGSTTTAARDIIALSNGDLVVTGTIIYKSILLSDHESDVLLLKVDGSAGGVLWDHGIGDLVTLPLPIPALNPYKEDGYSLKELSNGNLIVTGGTNSYTSGTHQGYLIETSSLGVLSWARHIGTGADDHFEGITITPTGLAMAGHTSGYFGGTLDRGYIAQTGTLNTTCNSQTCEPHDFMNDIQRTPLNLEEETLAEYLEPVQDDRFSYDQDICIAPGHLPGRNDDKADSKSTTKSRYIASETPVSEEINLQFNANEQTVNLSTFLNNATDIKIKIVNSLGEIVLSSEHMNYTSGLYSEDISLQSFSSGIYYVHVSIGAVSKTLSIPIY